MGGATSRTTPSNTMAGKKKVKLLGDVVERWMNTLSLRYHLIEVQKGRKHQLDLHDICTLCDGLITRHPFGEHS